MAKVATKTEGEKMKPGSRRWTIDDNTELDRLLNADKEAAEIAVALNRTRQAVYARLQRIYRKGGRKTKSEWG